MGHEILCTISRGDRVESAHRGAYCVVVNGRVDRSKGDIDVPIYYRSAAKPLQAIAVLESGAPERFGFTDQELALVIGSHSGSPMHAGTALSMLGKIGVDPEILRCGGHRPLDRFVYEEYIRRGYTWDRLEDNCSGKHSGMIGAAKAWGEDPARYAEMSARIQLENLDNVALFTGVSPGEIGIGVDGCAVPSFAVGIKAMAVAMQRFATPVEKVDTVGRIAGLMTRYPEMVAGEHRFDTVVMQLGEGRLLSKEGAEGVQVIGVVGKDIGIAVKIADGGQRAQQAVAAVLLSEYGLLPPHKLARFGQRAVLSRAGEPVGDLEVTL